MSFFFAYSARSDIEAMLHRPLYHDVITFKSDAITFQFDVISYEISGHRIVNLLTEGAIITSVLNVLNVI